MLHNDLVPSTVYKITRTDNLDDNTDVYVRSTSEKLSICLSLRKSIAKRHLSKLDRHMSEIGTENWKIESIIMLACDKKTIEKLEQNYINVMEPDLNKKKVSGF